MRLKRGAKNNPDAMEPQALAVLEELGVEY